ncbi:hypothetical protein FRC11_004280 [Ceratobasidium sp. 423]|nr:hypothetical protein FRC11_004280 [Ceratobasidium sp. 423]
MALMRNIPEVPEVTLDSLMNGVLHSLSLEELKSTYDKLILGGHIEGSDTDNPKWSCLPKIPSLCDEKEDVTFKFLEVIAQAVRASHSGVAKLRVELEVAGRTNPVGPRHNTSRPDGYFHIIEDPPRETVHWADVIMPMGFKNKCTTGTQADDFAKVMWSMHHIMRNDPRRRYVHGLTCEDTTARLWFNNRSDVVVSEKFDVNKDWKYFVRIILSIIVASRVDLGYDLDIEAVSPHDENLEPSYDITIHNPDTKKKTVYRTIGIISDVGADSMVGRGTRVWKVRKFENGHLIGPIYALKDVWVHEDRDPEHLIIQKIREQEPKYSRYFLTPIDFGFAPLNSASPSIPDSTHKTMCPQSNLEPTRMVVHILFIRILGNRTTESQSQKTSSTSRHGVGHGRDVPGSKLEGHRDFGYLSKYSRLHYRIVFEEVGDPVHDLRHFNKIFLAIQGGWEGVLPERGVIMDLEYTKATDDKKEPHDVKTGTAAFMATEVAEMQHHRLEVPRRVVLMPDLADLVPQLEGLWTGDDEPKPLPPFRHNPLHDMESIWWLCLWIMFYLTLSSTRSSQAQLNSYHEIFRNQAMKRLVMSGALRRKARHLWNNPLAPFGNVMELWADSLNNCYALSYGRHNASTDPLKCIQIEDEVLEKAYEAGQKCLMKLKDVSETLPECVTLLEQHQDIASTRMTDSEITHRIIMKHVHMDRPHSKKQRSNKSVAQDQDL